MGRITSHDIRRGAAASHPLLYLGATGTCDCLGTVSPPYYRLGNTAEDLFEHGRHIEFNLPNSK